MVNNYKRKTSQASWDEDAMKRAMEEAQTTSVSSAAKKFGITLSTLQRHIKKGSCVKKLGRFQTVFNDEQELELLEYVFRLDNLFHGLTKMDFLALTFQYAETNKIPHPFKNQIAGEDWFKGFKRRHLDLTLRRPEPTSVARVTGFNKPQVYRFYDILEAELSKHSIDATRIYNMDETGIQTTSNKPPKVLTKTGKKDVGVISSVERGKLTTVICCCNAAGSFVPPFLIYGRKRMVGRLLDGAPPGTSATCTDNGWINGPKFLEWLQHFVGITRPTSERKIMLILDNHESHKYLPALEYATENHVIFISLPPHTTHKMQPLDRCVYRPLKNYFEQEITFFQKNHVGRIISQYEVASLFGKAYIKAASTQNAINGFSSTGIWPTNRHVFDDSDFLPSTLTDRPEPPVQNQNVPAQQTAEATHETEEEENVTRPAGVAPLPAHNNDVSAPLATLAISEITEATHETKEENVTRPADVAPSVPVPDAQSVRNPVPVELLSPDNDVEMDLSFLTAESPLVPNKTVSCTSPTKGLEPEPTAEDSTAGISRPMCSTPIDAITLRLDSDPLKSPNHIRPIDIKPLPKLSPNKTTRKRKVQRAEVLTSTPIKEQQKEKQQKKAASEIKSAEKKKKANVPSLILPSTSKAAKYTKTRASNKQTKKYKKTSKNSELKYFCLVCEGPYQDPPEEDWIQCGDCAQWAHEACTSYGGRGSYFCDLCHE